MRYSDLHFLKASFEYSDTLNVKCKNISLNPLIAINFLDFQNSASPVFESRFKFSHVALNDII